MTHWKELLHKINNPTHTLKIALVGKYTQLSDAYISVVESLKHAGAAIQAKIELHWLASEECTSEEKAAEMLKDIDGIVVPGGFGMRGIEGKVNVIKYARENNIPYLGLCLGMQCAVIEFARHVAGIENANSTEFNENTPNPVIALMSEQENIDGYGGTMRLGAYECHLKPGTKAYQAYKTDIISERHRHRYEVNNKYRQQLADAGLVFSGLSPDEKLVEMIEIPQNDWFVACQFHPEFKSRPERPHPLFVGLINAVSKQVKEKNKQTVSVG